MFSLLLPLLFKFRNLQQHGELQGVRRFQVRARFEAGAVRVDRQELKSLGRRLTQLADSLGQLQKANLVTFYEIL